MELARVKVQSPQPNATSEDDDGRLLINNGMCGCVLSAASGWQTGDEESNDQIDNFSDRRLVFMFGGEAPNLNELESYNQCAIIDLRTMEARRVRPENGPDARSWGQMCVLGGTIYHFGGMRRPMDTFFNDVHALNARAMADLLTHEDPTAVWSELQCSGDLPTPRACSTFTPFADRRFILLVGGGAWMQPRFTSKMQIFDDIYKLCTRTHRWQQMTIQPNSSGNSMSRRWGHTANRVGNLLYIWGGQDLLAHEWRNDMWVLDTQKWCWQEIKMFGTPPLGRHGHSANLVNDEIVVVGGWGQREVSDSYGGSLGPKAVFFNDVHLFNVKTHTWRQIHLTDVPTRLPTFLPELSGHISGYVEEEKSLYLAAGIIHCQDRVVNEYAYILKVGPKRLVELCLEHINRHMGTLYICTEDGESPSKTVSTVTAMIKDHAEVETNQSQGLEATWKHIFEGMEELPTLSSRANTTSTPKRSLVKALSDEQLYRLRMDVRCQIRNYAHSQNTRQQQPMQITQQPAPLITVEEEQEQEKEQEEPTISITTTTTTSAPSKSKPSDSNVDSDLESTQQEQFVDPDELIGEGVVLPADLEERLTLYHKNFFSGNLDLAKKRWYCRTPPNSPANPRSARLLSVSSH